MVLGGTTAMIPARPAFARMMPARPPTQASTMLSHSNWRTIRNRLAPSDARTAISL